MAKRKFRLDVADIPDLVRERRQSLGLTIREVAEMSGVPHQTVSRVENGANSRLSAVSAILEALGIELYFVRL